MGAWLAGCGGGRVKHPSDVTSNHLQGSRQAGAELGEMRCAFPVLRVLGQVAHVVVDAGEQGEEGLAVHREGGAHQLVGDFVCSLTLDFFGIQNLLMHGFEVRVIHL